MACLHWIYPPYFTERPHSKLPSHLFKKEDVGLGGLPYNFNLRYIDRILKNGVSKSIFHMFKYANFQLNRVQPDGVI